jgi:hypothetical protein
VRELKYEQNYMIINNDIDLNRPAELSLFFLLFQKHLPRWLNHDIPPIRKIIQELARKLEKNRQSFLASQEVLVKRAFDGIEAVTRHIYPLVFLGMWGYDQYNYWQNSQNRYQMSLRDLFLGLPQNYHYENASLAANWGGDIASISRWNFWPWTGIIASALVSGILFTMVSRPRQTPIFYQIDHKEPRSYYQKFREDFVESFPYFTTYYWQLYRWKNYLIQKDYRQEQKDYQTLDTGKLKQEVKLEYESLLEEDGELKDVVDIYTDPDLDADTRIQLEKIVTSITDRSFFARGLGIQALGDIAYWRQDDKMGEFAAEKLSKAAGINPYIHYQLWSSGHSKNILAHFLGYFIVTPVQLFIRLRLWALLVTKVISLVRFLQDQHECQSDGNTWAYAAGNYVCTPCDWKFMDYRPRANYTLGGQDCVDALMSLPRSFEEIYSKMSAIQNHGPFSTVDFSRQNWTTWEVEQWRSIIGLLNTTSFNSISTLNLSRPIADSFPIAPAYLEILADYLPFSSVHYLDLSGLQLTEQNTLRFFAGLYNNSQIQYLGFSQSGVTDSILSSFIEALPSMSSLTTLALAGNQLTGLTLNLLQNASQTLNHLDFSYNLLTTNDIDTFRLNSTALQTLQLSGADLRGGFLNNFIATLSNSSLQTLIMDYCGITDSLAISLFTGIAGSLIQILSWAGNRIGYSAMNSIAALLNLTRLIRVNLNDNNIGDSALIVFANTLALNNSLQQLLLAGNPFGITGFTNLTASLYGSALSSLSVSRVNLGDSAAIVLSQLPSDHFPLTQLDLSDIGMTSTGATNLLPYFANTSLTDLNLQSNSFISDISVPLQQILNHTVLRSLNLRATGITAQSVIPVWPTLANSSLEKLDVSENRLGDEAAAGLGGNLTTSVPNLAPTLSSLEENVDGERAISRASATSRLRQVIWEDDMELTDTGAHGICEVIPSTYITPANLSMGGLSALNSRISGCPYYRGEAPSNSAAGPSAMVSWPVLILLSGLATSHSAPSFRVLAGLSSLVFGMVGGLPGALLGAVAGMRISKWFNPASSHSSFFYGIPSRQRNRQTNQYFSDYQASSARSCA